MPIDSLIDDEPAGPRAWQFFVLGMAAVAVVALGLIYVIAYDSFVPTDYPHRLLGAALWIGVPFAIECASLVLALFGALRCRRRAFWWGVGACAAAGLVQLAPMLLA